MTFVVLYSRERSHLEAAAPSRPRPFPVARTAAGRSAGRDGEEHNRAGVHNSDGPNSMGPVEIDTRWAFRILEVGTGQSPYSIWSARASVMKWSF